MKEFPEELLKKFFGQILKEFLLLEFIEYLLQAEEELLKDFSRE